MTRSIFFIAAVAAGLSAACSGDSATAPGGGSKVARTAPRTLALTSVSGHNLPAVYVRGQGDGWADSGTVTIQPDSIVAFRLYESATYPSGQPHVAQASTLFFTSGLIVNDSTILIHYYDATIPDTAIVDRTGTITLHLTGGGDVARTPLGTWLFSGAYHGPPMNPAPVVTGLTPQLLPLYTPDAVLEVTGKSFMPTIAATSAGRTLQVQFDTPRQIRIPIDSTLLQTVGSYQVRLANPEPGGGTYYFTYQVVNPPPIVTSVSPSTLHVASAEVWLTVHGSGFSPASIARWNGAQRHTEFVDRTTLVVGLGTSDIAVPGTAQLSVATPAPGGGTSASMTVTVAGTVPTLTSQIVVPMRARVIAADPTHPIVYAGVDSTDATYPNSIVALDGASGSVLWSVPIGGRPEVLTVSTDGQFIYASTLGQSQISRIATATHAIDLTIPLGTGPLGPYRANQILASPGNPATIAVQREYVTSAPYPYTDVGLSIYDGATARPTSTASLGDLPPLFAYGDSPSVIYAVIGSGYYRVSVDASGATLHALADGASVNGGTGPELRYGNGVLYTTYGYDYDVATQKPLPLMPGLSPFAQTIALSTDGRTLYRIAIGPIQLQAYDLVQRAPIGGVSITDTYNKTTNLVRWGIDGLAFVSGSLIASGEAVYLIRADFVH